MTKKNLQTFLGDLSEYDYHDGDHDDFNVFFDEGCRLLNLDDHALATLFDTSQPNISRWRKHVIPPCAGLVIKILKAEIERAVTTLERYEVAHKVLMNPDFLEKTENLLFKTTAEQKLLIPAYLREMHQYGYSKELIRDVELIAKVDGGVFDLLKMWFNAESRDERRLLREDLEASIQDIMSKGQHRVLAVPKPDNTAKLQKEIDGLKKQRANLRSQLEHYKSAKDREIKGCEWWLEQKRIELERVKNSRNILHSMALEELKRDISNRDAEIKKLREELEKYVQQTC